MEVAGFTAEIHGLVDADAVETALRWLAEAPEFDADLAAATPPFPLEKVMKGGLSIPEKSARTEAQERACEMVQRIVSHVARLNGRGYALGCGLAFRAQGADWEVLRRGERKVSLRLKSNVGISGLPEDANDNAKALGLLLCEVCAVIHAADGGGGMSTVVPDSSMPSEFAWGAAGVIAGAVYLPTPADWPKGTIERWRVERLGGEDGVVNAETLDEAMLNCLDAMDGFESIPQDMEVTGFRRPSLTYPADGSFTDAALEGLDAEYGDPNGISTLDTSLEEQEAMREAEARFVAATIRNYHPWALEPAGMVSVNVRDWVREHRPQWLEALDTEPASSGP